MQVEIQEKPLTELKNRFIKDMKNVDQNIKVMQNKSKLKQLKNNKSNITEKERKTNES